MQYSWQDLGSADADQVARAADALFASGRAAEVFAEQDAVEALVKAVEHGNRTAALVLLLGYAPGGIPVLRRLQLEKGDEPVKLKPWSRTVPLRVAATAALSRAGDKDARRSLLESATDYGEAERIFLLDILPFIDAPEVWHQLSTYMDDETEIPEGVPSGAPRRRVCDHAVDAFVDFLSLPVSFERRPGGRYSAQDVAETLQLFRQQAPR